MKKYLYLLAIVFTGLPLFSCLKEGAGLFNFAVTVSYPAGYIPDDLSNVKVSMVNIITGRLDTARTDISGVAVLSLEEGTYTLSASIKSVEFAFNGIKENVIINPLKLSLSMGLEAVALKGGLVFKEIFYTGSKTPAATNYYADQFHEIYNNSDDVIYLDGLCMGVLEALSANASVWVKPGGGLRDTIPITFQTWMWPGTGTDYPLAPRTSIVIAQDGINHKSDPLGNATSPVDLGSANWETYISTSNKDTDTPGVPNLICIYTTAVMMVDWVCAVSGSAVVIFRLPTGLDYSTFVNNPANLKTKPGSSATTQYLQIDKAWVIDAVEEVQADPTKQFKRLPTSLDAGKVFCSGSYVGKSIRRKVEKIIGGKIIYKDTNNSSEDFIGDQVPKPFIHPETVDQKK